MNSRTKARLRAVESLFEADQRGEDPVEVLQRRRLHTAAQISSYSEQIVRGVRDRPDAVAISEATGLARVLSTNDSPKFVNGLLDKLRRVKPTLLA